MKYLNSPISLQVQQHNSGSQENGISLKGSIPSKSNSDSTS